MGGSPSLQACPSSSSHSAPFSSLPSGGPALSPGQHSACSCGLQARLKDTQGKADSQAGRRPTRALLGCGPRPASSAPSQGPGSSRSNRRIPELEDTGCPGASLGLGHPAGHCQVPGSSPVKWGQGPLSTCLLPPSPVTLLLSRGRREARTRPTALSGCKGQSCRARGQQEAVAGKVGLGSGKPRRLGTE